jgi:ligand-binding SRPBCC domain-containing protein
MKPHILEKKTIIERPIDEVFNFFSDAYNLNKITPDSLNFKIITPFPIHMHVGTLIDYEIKMLGIPFNWKTKITAWEPGKKFVDEQLSGPYKLWIHEHLFEDFGNKTLMTDTVKYQSPGGIFEFIPHHLFVKLKVEEIFNYREKTILEYFKNKI